MLCSFGWEKKNPKNKKETKQEKLLQYNFAIRFVFLPSETLKSKYIPVKRFQEMGLST